MSVLIPETKQCRTCKEVKPLSEFYRAVYHRYGVHDACKTCVSTDRRRKLEKLERDRALNPEIVEGKSRVCNRCSTEKSLNAFYINADCQDGAVGICKECVKEQRAKRAEKNVAVEKPAEKDCIRCGQVKPSSEFYTHSGFPDGLEATCKICKRAQRKANRDANPELEKKKRDYQKKRRKNVESVKHYWGVKYGLSLEEAEQILENQNFQCPICLTSYDQITLNVDHCHVTGAIRGLLCGLCNAGLGHLRDDVEMLERAKAYLLKGKTYGNSSQTEGAP